MAVVAMLRFFQIHSMAKSPKFYVVWRGFVPGVYNSWADCEAQVKGFPDAAFKAFASRDAALAAFDAGPEVRDNAPSTSGVRASGGARPVAMPRPEVLQHIEADAIAVDAACSSNPGAMEYRGVDLRTGQEIFHFGPILGTNNIGEFLAIVHALALLDKAGERRTIYSDSVNAINWVERKQCRTTLVRNEKTAAAHDMIARAEAWLHAHRRNCPLRKWQTTEWGEIPADFGRK